MSYTIIFKISKPIFKQYLRFCTKNCIVVSSSFLQKNVSLVFTLFSRGVQLQAFVHFFFNPSIFIMNNVIISDSLLVKTVAECSKKRQYLRKLSLPHAIARIYV
jgi:fumarate reductase subunit C